LFSCKRKGCSQGSLFFCKKIEQNHHEKSQSAHAVGVSAKSVKSVKSVVFLILCLGNIGPEYADTRHNIGFMVADYLAQKFEAPRFELGRHAFTTEFKHKGHRYVLVKPTTFMNLSGKAAAHWLSTLKITPENMLVVTDDLALPFGKLRLKGQGSAGGHNGLKDIQATLGTDVYARLRFGVDANFPKGRQVDYVLNPFSADEQIDLPLRIEKAGEAVLAFGALGLERSMNIVNVK
jgi:PTH1 family peptidyl-tRNA hydrolase